MQFRVQRPLILSFSILGSLSPLFLPASVWAARNYTQEFIPGGHIQGRTSAYCQWSMPKLQCVVLSKEGLRAAEELRLGWNNQEAVSGIRGGRNLKSAKYAMEDRDKGSSQKKTSGRLHRAGRGKEGSNIARDGLVCEMLWKQCRKAWSSYRRK